MAGFDAVVRNGRAVLPTGAGPADIAIRDGRIAAIGEPGSIDAEQVHDAAGQLVMPGGIDMHVHFRDPGFTEKEDFAHGSAAAACGGITVVCDMPNTKPPVTTGGHFRDKVAIASRQSWIDFGLWAGGFVVEEFDAMLAAGAVGLKIYMNRPRSAKDPYANELSMPDDAMLARVLRASARIGWPVSVHLASPAIDNAKIDELQAAGVSDPCAVCYSLRSPESVEALTKIVLFAEVTGARVHIAHLSLNAFECLRVFAEGRARNPRLTAEIVPPSLDIRELERVGVFGVPFAHAKDELEEYWGALANGVIDAIATDHAPHTRADKERGRADSWQAPPGYPGVETSYALLIDAVMNGRVALSKAAELIAANPARILGLEDKGQIAVGKDADLAFVDTDAEWVIDEKRLHSKAGWSPYHGRRLQGRIRRTMLRGEVIAEDGELVAARPAGRMVRATVDATAADARAAAGPERSKGPQGQAAEGG